MIQILEVSKPAQPLDMNKQQTCEHCKGRCPHITCIRVRGEQHNSIRILNTAGKLLNTDVTTEELDLMKKKGFFS